jgi:hypothetical protein
MRTIADIKTDRQLSAPKVVTTREEMVFSKIPETACTIPVGTQLEVYFSQVNPSRIYFEYNGSLRVTSAEWADKRFTGFSKKPGISTLRRWDMDGYCKTITGKKTEPDGFGEDGSPSWMLAMGLI